jgi:hypothetical protein
MAKDQELRESGPGEHPAGAGVNAIFFCLPSKPPPISPAKLGSYQEIFVQSLG